MAVLRRLSPTGLAPRLPRLKLERALKVASTRPDMFHNDIAKGRGLKTSIVVICSLFAILTVSFQNCSAVHFAAADSASLGSEANNSVDALLCAAGAPSGDATQMYPTACLITPPVPANSLGLEMNNNARLAKSGQPNVFVLPADDQINGTPSEQTLYLELSTYMAPDTFVIEAESVGGQKTTLLNICNIATWTKGDTTQGLARPQSNTILQFNVKLPRRTAKLRFDFTSALSPTYLGIWNLGAFANALNQPSTNPYTAVSTSYTSYYRVQHGLPTPLNDGIDSDPKFAGLCH